MGIAIVNQSSVITDADARLMASVCDMQLARDVGPLWGLIAPLVSFVGSTVPHVGDSIVFADTDPTPGAAGYHTEDGTGRASGVIIVGVVLADGTLMEGPQSVSACLSHEVVELLLDRAVNLWASSQDGFDYPREGCDAVQSSGYVIRPVSGREVAVSNFLLPGWFDDFTPPSGKCDFLGLTRPFRIATDGYTMRRSSQGSLEEIGLRAAWKDKALPRTRRGVRHRRPARPVT